MHVYIGIGSNLGDRQAHLRAGIEGLRKAGLEPITISSIWESEPIDTSAPEWFLNMAVRGQTELRPLALLELLLALERRNGRMRGDRNGPRTLDLDLLMAGELQFAEPRLTLPHPRMWDRRFVLEPLAEIAPDLKNPANGRTVAEEFLRVRPTAIVRRRDDLAGAEGVPL